MPFNIGDFLKKFKNIVPQEKIIKDEVIRVVQKETGILLPKEIISFHNNVVFINAAPSVKNELFMRKQQLLLEIKRNLGNGLPTDLR